MIEKKTKSKSGKITLFYSPEEGGKHFVDKDDAMCPAVVQKINHKKWVEECRITEYKDGWTTINYGGLNVIIPSRFIEFYGDEGQLPQELVKSVRRKQL